MIGWAKHVLATAWIISSSLGCAAATPRASTPGSATHPSVRSPPLDYADGLRSASDGDIMGAHREPAQDWLLGGATTDHVGPGWALRNGRPHFEYEQVRAGSDAPTAPACLPGDAPLAPDELEAHAAFRRAWLSVAREPALAPFATALADLPEERSGFLSCDRR